jgi:hypothetical protein
LSPDAEEHIAAAEAFYRPVILGPGSRLERGAKLWRQYEDARDACRRGATDFVPVYERINEMAAAHILLSDLTLNGATVAYETPIAANGSLIDFIVSRPAGRPLYVEVKTIHPRTEDCEASWTNFEQRRVHHPDNVHYIVDKEWMGGKIYGDSFASRSSFMTYTVQFEERLAAANDVQLGEGILLFCGTGIAWHLSELEDFVDFYRSGAHRQADAFSKMEEHALTRQNRELRRNISEFAYIRRPMNYVTPEKWFSKVQGQR